MEINKLYRFAGLLLGLILFMNCLGQESNRPNIIFILADDIGYADFSCYGADKIKTPEIDKLAKEGVIFTDAHSSASVCSPSRYSLLTGRYCWRSSLKEWVLGPNDPLLIEPDRITIQSMLKQNGYKTACIGKWHLGIGSGNLDWEAELFPGPIETGFDFFFGIPSSPNMNPFVYVENHQVVKHRQYDVFVHKHRVGNDMAKIFTQKAVSFIEKNRDSPFFLYLATSNIHNPKTPHESFVGKSEAGIYGDFVLEFDWIVGQITKALNENNLSDNTLVIVSSDNGPNSDALQYGHDSNGIFKGYKADIWEGGHRVPFVARWPYKIKPNTVNNKMICQVDMLATIADICEVKLDENTAEDSYSILPYFLETDKDQNIRNYMVNHSCWGAFSLRDGKWKLIAPRENLPVENGVPTEDENVWWMRGIAEAANTEVQLYNLEVDPGEKIDLSGKFPDKTNKMLEKLNKIKNNNYEK